MKAKPPPKSRQAKWRLAHQAEEKARHAAWAKSAEGRAHRAAYMRAYRKRAKQ